MPEEKKQDLLSDREVAPGIYISAWLEKDKIILCLSAVSHPASTVTQINFNNEEWKKFLEAILDVDTRLYEITGIKKEE